MTKAPADNQRHPHRSITLGPDFPTVVTALLFFVVVMFTVASPLLQWMRLWFRN